MSDPELCFTPALDLARLVACRRLSPVDLVTNALARIDEVNPTINAFCSVFPERALERARMLEEEAQCGTLRGPLHGVPVAIKDLTPTAGYPTTFGSRVFADHVGEDDAVVVRRLFEAGAIMVGKTNTPEFAYSGFTRNELHGETRNPWSLERSPGGSSGGSAAAVATGCVPLAEGSDGGGSVRDPAACCGITGLKPSFGRIPFDIFPTQFSTIFHFGPLARTVADAALFLAVANGPDDADIQSLTQRLDVPVPPPGNVRGLKIALNIDFGFFHVDAEVEGNLRVAAAALAERGAIIEEVDLVFDRQAIYACEADVGSLAALLQGDVVRRHPDRVTPRVAAMVESGAGYSGTDVKRFELARTKTWQALAPVLARHDALLCPTQGGPAPLNSQSEADFDWVDDEGRYHGHFMSQFFNFTSHVPAFSVPSGFTGDGLPTAVQIVGRRHDDNMVLRIGQALEGALGWPAHRPPL